MAGPSGSSSATRVTTASPTGPAPPSPRGQTAVSYPPEGGEGLTARILKRPRSTSTQDDPATSSYDSDLRRENVERKLNPSLATALTGDAASLLLDVTQTLQREQRRLEEVLTAIQRGNASSESSTASTAFDGSGRRKSFEGGITLREHLSQLPAIETCERLFNFYFHEVCCGEEVGDAALRQEALRTTDTSLQHIASRHGAAACALYLTRLAE